MYGQTHAGLGWVIGVVPRATDRRLRIWCVAAALLPDVDAGAMLFGRDAYVRWHHKPGHNVFLGILCVLAAAVHFRSRPWRERCLAVLLVAVCFASHLLTDMKLSGWESTCSGLSASGGTASSPCWRWDIRSTRGSSGSS